MTLARPSAPPMDYEDAKRLARSEFSDDRQALATRTDVRPEILYFLAEDSGPEVRRAVAANDATPVQAGLLLAGDPDIDVRSALAVWIGRLAPELDGKEDDRLGQVVNQVLDVLSGDGAARVRRILSEELKSCASAPPTVIERLARDEDETVACPILEHSPLLPDEVLLDIVAGLQGGAPLAAISRRTGLGPAVADAVIATDDRDAITALLSNSSAQIREETLDALTDRAEAVPAWHEPLVDRPCLSTRAVCRLSEFVADALLSDLERRRDIDAETAAGLAESVKRRLGGAGPLFDEETREPAEDRAKGLLETGRLDERAILDALESGDRSLAIEGMALLADLPGTAVARTISMASAKGIVAVAWKAGLTMSAATRLQTGLCRLPPDEILKASSEDGFPLSEDEMLWQLEFLTG